MTTSARRRRGGGFKIHGGKLGAEAVLSDRAATTKEEIIQVAARAFARNGFSSTSLDMIAAEFGFSKPALYYYFRSKEAILSALFDQMTTQFAEAAHAVANLPMPVEEKMRALIQQHVHLVLERPDWHTVYTNEARHLSDEGKLKVRKARRKYDRIMQETYEEGVRSGVFKNLDSFVIGAGIIGMINSFPDWYRSRGKLSVNTLAELCWQMIGSGICVGDRDGDRDKVEDVSSKVGRDQ